VPEPDDTTSDSTPAEEQSATQRYLEYRERMLRYDREYLDRLKQHEAAPQPPPKTPDLPWGHPICDSCPSRVGCSLQHAMKRVDDIKSGGR
jgi:hypothetical protein